MGRSKRFFVFAAIAAVSITLAACGDTASEVKVTKDNNGDYTAECSAECAVVEQDLAYTIRLKVTTDADGAIVRAEDNGTEIPDGMDGAYKKAEALFEELAGKNVDTIKDVDAVSGATLSSEAILAAAEQGLDAIDHEINGAG